MKNKVVIIGAGGAGKSVLQIVEDLNKKNIHMSFLGLLMTILV